MPRTLLVTAALPYANGPIHIGHLVEYIQTDVWVRFQRLRGHRCLFVCADDTHGAAIMIRARQEGRSSEELIAAMGEAHQRDFAAFGVSFDHYGSTNSESNRELCAGIWSALRGAGLVEEREVTRLYDPEAKTFLADRFVKGECPRCDKEDQYGDSCENCGATYSATDLGNPRSTLSGATPELRPTAQLFVKFAELQEFLRDWTQNSGALQPEVANYLRNHFLKKPLQDWDVSRPEPYFGFEIPDAPRQYWYVWFDAPVGYIASTADWCAANGGEIDDWWRNPEVEIHHFIGKDITYFHTLFWPAMLKVAGYELPRRIRIHGFLQVQGEKMSKSRGTFIEAATYLKHLDPAYLRYYFASKLSSKIDDIDLGVEEFVGKVNSDLVGRLVNLASRTARFVEKTGLCTEYPDDGGLFAAGAAAGEAIAEAYEAGELREATRLIMGLADRANEYVEQRAPWNLRKDPDQAEALQQVCTVVLNLFRQMMIYLTPVAPALSDRVGELLDDPIRDWAQAEKPLLGTPVAKFKHLLTRVDPAAMEAMFAEAGRAEDSLPAQVRAERGDLAPTIEFDQFAALDLRVATVSEASRHPKADRLLVLKLDLGFESRTVVAGIAGAYAPEELTGTKVVVVANLAPRKLRGIESQGMILAGDDPAGQPRLIRPDPETPNGVRIK